MEGLGGEFKHLSLLVKKSVISLLCPPKAFATCSAPEQFGIYHDAVVAELVDAQR
jgi:hypothetical protein